MATRCFKKPAVSSDSCGRSVNEILKCTAQSPLLLHSGLLFVVDAKEHVTVSSSTELTGHWAFWNAKF